MDESWSSADRDLHFPRVRRVDALRPLNWLGSGWGDLRDNAGASLPYGLVFAGLGYLILSYAADLPYLFTAALSGFFLIGPLAAAGFYEVSRRHQQGEAVSFRASLCGLRRHADHLLYYGVFLALVLAGWERLSSILFALFYGGSESLPGEFVREVFLSGDYTLFVLSYLVVGGALAAVVFALSVVSVPMMMDRDIDMGTAMTASVRAASSNPAAMGVWAALIVALVAVGFATMMIGLVILLPLLGHATWHAYQDLVE